MRFIRGGKATVTAAKDCGVFDAGRGFFKKDSHYFGTVEDDADFLKMSHADQMKSCEDALKSPLRLIGRESGAGPLQMAHLRPAESPHFSDDAVAVSPRSDRFHGEEAC
jgi:hypothetical protein